MERRMPKMPLLRPCLTGLVGVLLASLWVSCSRRVGSSSAPEQVVWSEVPYFHGRIGHAMAFDRARGRIVSFGGINGFGPLSDTWESDGGSWGRRSPTTSPPPRLDHALTYDAARARVVLFGGWSDYSSVFSDTWEWDGGNWARRSPVTSPSARRGHAMAYDSARGCVMLFGGLDSSRSPLSDTWEWDGNDWVQRFPATS